ncbi:unnamed protein product [Fraxinus pennsylvanica]|uniref:Beta-glucosidase n=1 Tax=Fraxinus pennsylvanica TaxID=56036 RepID=A0AAD2DQA3_9LAMI|nr:unnamed protein product [Fraxinus pennsylvanica]
MIASADGSPLIEYPVSSQVNNYTLAKIKRSDFRDDFAFGAATSAYQIEGAWNVGSKGMSIWDVFTQKQPGGIADGSNGCVAIDHYNMFREDVTLMKKLGLNSYRFSIAWSRILPGGRLCTGIDKDGIKFYNDLIDALLTAGIEPYVTLFHWDVPQCLEEDYGGFLSEKIVKDFCEFAEICFWEFGDRVKYWITLNEPWSFSVQGYATGAFPPNRGKHPTTTGEATTHSRLHRGRSRHHIACKYGDPGTEPYRVAHNLILSHAYAVDIYKAKYQEKYQNPVIYITENGVDEVNDKSKSGAQCLSDEMRIHYFQDHLYNLKQAMNQGVNVKGYFIWSLFDNYEWAAGYTVRFGIIYVDYVNGRYTRLPKNSAVWLRKFLTKKVVNPANKEAEKADERRKRLRSG